MVLSWVVLDWIFHDVAVTRTKKLPSGTEVGSELLQAALLCVIRVRSTPQREPPVETLPGLLWFPVQFSQGAK